MTYSMKHSAREYEEMALKELDLGLESTVEMGDYRELRAQVFATLALAAVTEEHGQS